LKREGNIPTTDRREQEAWVFRKAKRKGEKAAEAINGLPERRGETPKIQRDDPRRRKKTGGEEQVFQKLRAGENERTTR